MKTLLVEDNPADIRLIRELLKESAVLPFEFHQVSRLDLALERLRDESFDVVLLDLGLPDSQGMETLRLAHKTKSTTPIVVLTGLNDDQFALQVVHAGAQDYLVKGQFDSQLLVRTIRYAVERKQAEEEVRRLNTELESRVAERTMQLQHANEELLKRIAERQRAQEALRESREWLRVTLTSIGDAVIASDTKGRITFMNPIAATLTGWRPEEAQNQPIQSVFRMINEETRIAVGDIVARAIETGHVIKLANQTALLAKNGREIPIEESVAPIMHSTGAIIGAVLVFQDVSEKRRAQEALRESEERFRLMVESVKDYAIFMLDAQGYVSTWNVGSERMKGYSAEQIIGKHFSCFYTPEDIAAGKPQRELDTAAKQGQHTEEGWRLLQDGRRFWADVTITGVRDPAGRLLGFSKVTRDITQKRRAEEALRQSERLTFQRQQLQALAKRLHQAREDERKLVARELHDQIGQILTAIKFDMTWVARHQPQTEDGVHKRLARSIELINEGVKSVRTICSGLRPGILDDVGLAAAIEWQANEFTSRTAIPCLVSLPPAALVLDGDRATAIFRIFQECLTNVARHAEAQSVHTSLYTQDEDLLLVVKDDGKGFCESEVGGSLGVLGMKERAAACGGSVQVSSSPGIGTLVTVRVPVRAAGVGSEDQEYSAHR